MPYTYENRKRVLYYLHAKRIALRNGYQRTIYYFARKYNEFAIAELPTGYRVKEGPNGLPLLAKA